MIDSHRTKAARIGSIIETFVAFFWANGYFSWKYSIFAPNYNQ